MRMPTAWKPVAIDELQRQLGSFTEWNLCGGYSLDLILGRPTRSHGDIDIGVYRSEVVACLRAIGKERVFLCNSPGAKMQCDGKEVDPTVHDIWISDRLGDSWLFQIMVFDDEGETVFYRRDRRISWPKSSHSLRIGGMNVLNPFITFLYKANKPKIEEKEATDLGNLIAAAVNWKKTD